LLKIKQTLGFVDPRIGLKSASCATTMIGGLGACGLPANSAGANHQATRPDPEAEKVVQMVTDLIMERIGK